MKAILVIDMPSCCNSCRYCEYIQSDEYTRCILECREVKNDMKKPNWCPLKPMPQRKRTIMQYQIGYNTCIDEILGGNE